MTMTWILGFLKWNTVQTNYFRLKTNFQVIMDVRRGWKHHTKDYLQIFVFEQNLAKPQNVEPNNMLYTCIG